MLCYVIGFLLINTYSGSLGLAIPSPQPTAIATSLVALASHCKSPFLLNQIKSKLSDCSVVVPPYNEKQFECLIFYDINKQLCDAVAASKLELTEDYSAKINEPYDVQKLCSLGKKWNIPSIVEYPFYKSTVDKVLEKTVACVKLCGVDDIMSQDSNFFCKYYKWGSEMLSQVSSPPKQEENNVPSAQSGLEAEVKKKPDSVVTNGADVSGKLGNSAPAPDEPINGDAPLDTTFPKKQQVNTDISNTGTKPKTLPVPQNPSDSENDKIVNGNPLGQQDNINNKKISTVGSHDNVDQSNVAIDKPGAAIDHPGAAIDHPGAAIDHPGAAIDHPGAAIDHPGAAIDHLAGAIDLSGAAINNHDAAMNNLKGDLKPPLKKGDAANNLGQLNDQPAGLKEQGNDRVPPLEDYQGGNDPDADEESEGLPLGGEDGGDSNVGESDQKLNTGQTKNSAKGDGEKDFFPNTMPDGFNDGDDHFFPVFLTAVVLVVLLYVLYHNKNKVSKMFLGLVVEGRQPGRRRNSRGHAYRRLDTLEQAMSDKSAAPPSKIIY